jgi:rRNA pseudouridine-1189 N-methylase Emg1 (Nep1/Mra1 family)
MEQLLSSGRVPPTGDVLLQVIDKTLGELMNGLHAEQTILAIEGGQKTTIHGLTELLPTDSSTHVVVGVGAFPHGDLPESITSLFENRLEFDTEVMMAWHVCAELLWTYSLSVGVVKGRFSVT